MQKIMILLLTNMIYVSAAAQSGECQHRFFTKEEKKVILEYYHKTYLPFLMNDKGVIRINESYHTDTTDNDEVVYFRSWDVDIMYDDAYINKRTPSSYAFIVPDHLVLFFTEDNTGGDLICYKDLIEDRLYKTLPEVKRKQRPLRNTLFEDSEFLNVEKTPDSIEYRYTDRPPKRYYYLVGTYKQYSFVIPNK